MQRIHFRTIRSMLFDRGHANHAPLLDDHFLASCHFYVIDPQSSVMLPKNQFWEESDPLTEQSHNFTMKWFMRKLIHIFPSSFTEIVKAEVTKWVRGIHHKKGWYFAPFSGASGMILPKILWDHSFPFPHPSAKFCPSPSSFWEDISEHVF